MGGAFFSYHPLICFLESASTFLYLLYDIP